MKPGVNPINEISSYLTLCIIKEFNTYLEAQNV